MRSREITASWSMRLPLGQHALRALELERNRSDCRARWVTRARCRGLGRFGELVTPRRAGTTSLGSPGMVLFRVPAASRNDLGVKGEFELLVLFDCWLSLKLPQYPLVVRRCAALATPSNSSRGFRANAGILALAFKLANHIALAGNVLVVRFDMNLCLRQVLLKHFPVRSRKT